MNVLINYFIELRYRISVKGYGFLYFAKHIGKSIGKIITNNLSSKYNQKLIDHAEQ